MTGRKKSSEAISATELMAQLQSDPGYQRKLQATSNLRVREGHASALVSVQPVTT